MQAHAICVRALARRSAADAGMHCTREPAPGESVALVALVHNEPWSGENTLSRGAPGQGAPGAGHAGLVRCCQSTAAACCTQTGQ